jgi:phosphopantetheinyl transferase
VIVINGKSSMNLVVVQSYHQILDVTPKEQIAAVLSPEDLEKAARFYHKEDSDRFIAARILLWH